MTLGVSDIVGAWNACVDGLRALGPWGPGGLGAYPP